jgi:pyochelin biosynthetic protein PchC
MARGWLRPLAGEADARLTLVCLPHAGGTASLYRAWLPWWPPGIRLVAVQYPGRMDRLREPALTRVDELADAIAAECAALDSAVALFGHSFGATVAYEVAVRRTPIVLFVSAQPAPHRMRRGTRHLGTDDELWAAMTAIGGVAGAPAQSREFRELVVPPFRADLTAAETYGPRPPVPVPAPLHAFAGAGDRQLSPGEVRRWAAVAGAGFRRTVLAGGHFFVAERAAEVVGEVTSSFSHNGAAPST